MGWWPRNGTSLSKALRAAIIASSGSPAALSSAFYFRLGLASDFNFSYAGEPACLPACQESCGYCNGPDDYNLYGHDYVDVNGMGYRPIYYTHKNYNW